MKQIIFIALLSLHSLSTIAQEKKSITYPQRAQRWSISASVSETKILPLFKTTGINNSITNVFHPKYAINAERNWKVKKGTRKYIGAELSYHNNYLVDRAIGLNINVGIEYKVYQQFYVGFGTGLGFAKAKRADLVYELSNGVWEPKTYPGKWQYNRLGLRGNAELGYRLKRYPADVFVGTNAEIQYNYLGKDVPFNIVQSPFKIGARWHLQQVGK
jgi:hypothetical protein